MQSALDEIVTLAKRQVDIELQIAQTAQTLADLNEMLRKLCMEDLPAAMAEAKLKEFTLDSGEKVLVRPDFTVGIPAQRREEAFDWLNTNGYGGIVKTELSISFGKGEYDKAAKLAAELTEKKFECELERAVHWQTLKAFVVERVKAKVKLPMDMFGAHDTTKSVVQLPKKAKV